MESDLGLMRQSHETDKSPIPNPSPNWEGSWPIELNKALLKLEWMKHNQLK